jgi:hypothetical protein
VFERNGATLTGWVESFDGTVLTQTSHTDTAATLLSGGKAGFISAAGADYTFDNFTYVTAVPEPVSAGLFGIAALGLLARRRQGGLVAR